MLDPFPIPPPAFLQRLTKPVADYLSLPTLPLHIHEVIFSIALYTFIFNYVSPILSTFLCPRTYPNLNTRTRINWDVHVVSMFQSIIICFMSFYIIAVDQERKEMNWAGRIWGYTGISGLMQAMAAGYFIWDLVLTALHVEIFGYGMLAHAVAATTVFSLGFRPFVNYYGPVFILYELSSPFNNIHWFLDKLSMTGSLYQWVNGMVLITTFFLCRIVWGAINSYLVFSDVYTAWTHGTIAGSPSTTAPFSSSSPGPAGLKLGLNQDVPAAVSGSSDPQSEVMRFASDRSVPIWLAGSYLLSNIVLNLLNYYWMGKMVETIRKRFDPPFGTKGVGEKSKHEKEEGDTLVQRGVYEDGRRTVEVQGQEVRSRRRA